MNLRFILLLLIFPLPFHSFSQKRIKWVIVQGKVTDTFGYALPSERIALISKKGNDKSIQITDEFGRFSFMVKKKKLKDYAVRCYCSRVRHNQTISLDEFIRYNEYVVNTNQYYVNHKLYKFLNEIEFACIGYRNICKAGIEERKDKKFYNTRYMTDINEVLRSYLGMVK